MAQNRANLPNLECMRRRRGTQGLLLVVVLVAAALVGQPVTASATAPPTGQRSFDRPVVRVATFNIRSVKNDVQSAGDEQPWRERRQAVIRQILGEHLDVVGLQEASQNGKYTRQMVDGRNQFLDLRNGLRKAGGSWQVTSTASYNCVRPYASHDCEYQDRGASRTTKILYNSHKVEKIRSGSFLYRHQSGGENDERYLVWAVFEARASGKRFFFADTHLSNGSAQLQKDQWRELIDKVNELKDGLPTIVVGDFQRSRMKNPVTDMLDAMRAAGYGDVLGQRPGEPVVENPRARKTVQSWVSSMNNFDRDARDFSFEDRNRDGNFIDWIFASNELPVRQYEVVADIDHRTMKLRGVIPSDHNMVRASVVLR
jgi:endonuclease/exonuclease/phosphatase family metal-dependent hydrolase